MLFIAVFSTPVGLLCLYLAFLCYRQTRYPQALVMALIAAVMLVITVAVIGIGLFTGQTIQDGLAPLTR
ncbi:MAG: hypothetical protein P1P74_02630 [Desulfuromonadales bacterium]|nr:hypothetical protein [Desulfuromonadales bacterium]MDT8422612.1 hypothetical protein [Desulfuromonadales bacterium]